jgi:hypothetical protein
LELGLPPKECNLRAKQTGYNNFLLVPDTSDYVLRPFQGNGCIFRAIGRTETTLNVDH